MTKTMDDDDDINNDDIIQTKTVFRRHSKGPVMFNGCSPSGDVIIIDNICSIKSYDLTGWYIERETDCQPLLRYTFTDKFIIQPSTTIEFWSSTSTPISMSDEIDHEQQHQSLVTIKTKLLTWNTARQWSINRLFDKNGREKAIFSHRTLTPTDDKEKE